MLKATLLITIILCWGSLYAQEVDLSKIYPRSLRKHPNGLIDHVRIKNNQTIQGYPVSNWLAFDDKGNLIGADLATSIKHLGDTIPKASRIAIYPDGNLKWVLLAQNTIIQGYHCIGYGAESPVVAFWGNGKIKLAYLNKAITAHNLTSKTGSFAPHRFYDDGKIHSLVISSKQRYQGQEYNADTELYFDKSGKVVKSYRPNWLKRIGMRLLDTIV